MKTFKLITDDNASEHHMKSLQYLVIGISLLLVACTSFLPSLYAQELIIPESAVYRARVLDILDTHTEILSEHETRTVQTIKAKIINGDRKGDTVVFKSDYYPLRDGERFFILSTYHEIYNEFIYSVSERDRSVSLLILFVLFIITISLFAGRQGIRALMALAGSVFIIAFVLIPQMLAGVSPLLLSIAVGMLILILAIMVTHGWNRTSAIALLGTSLTLIVTSFLAWCAVRMTRLSGIASDETFYLNNNTGGMLDIHGLLLGGIIIGILGILDDIAITQVAVVQQLWSANPELSVRDVFRRALSVGKDHMSSLVNTLVLAYMGVGLPLMLLFGSLGTNFLEIVNREVVTTEIIRMLVGGIGLILCVPITTWLAVVFYRNPSKRHFHHDLHTHHHHHHH